MVLVFAKPRRGLVAVLGRARLLTAKKFLETLANSSLAQLAHVTNPASVSNHHCASR